MVLLTQSTLTDDGSLRHLTETLEFKIRSFLVTFSTDPEKSIFCLSEFRELIAQIIPVVNKTSLWIVTLVFYEGT